MEGSPVRGCMYGEQTTLDQGQKRDSSSKAATIIQVRDDGAHTGVIAKRVVRSSWILSMFQRACHQDFLTDWMWDMKERNQE